MTLKPPIRPIQRDRFLSWNDHLLFRVGITMLLLSWVYFHSLVRLIKFSYVNATFINFIRYNKIEWIFRFLLVNNLLYLFLYQWNKNNILKKIRENLSKSQIYSWLLALLLLDEAFNFFTLLNILDNWLIPLIFVIQNFWILEMLNQAGKALKSGICKNTNLKIKKLFTLSLLNLSHFLLWNFL